ncbi:MAG: hypothetical protein RR891_10740 [Clostridium sp.]
MRGKYDLNMLNLLESIGTISIKQVSDLWYKNYNSSARRLSKLEKMELISSYYDRRTLEKIYYLSDGKPISEHNQIINNYIINLMIRGYEIIGFSKTTSFLSDKLRPDLYIKYRLNDKEYTSFLEVDYTHMTDDYKIKKYEELYADRIKQIGCKFNLIIAKDTTLNVNSRIIDITHVNLNLEGQ